jgi:hypothetical protein
MEALAAEPSPSVTALSAEFLDSAGSRCRGPWSEVWCNPFERGAPVRSFPSFKRQKNFTGLYYAATMDAHVGFESWLERDVAMMLDFDSRVVAFSSQPFCLWWAENGERHHHSPDFFARLADGTGAVMDVRPDDRIKPRDARAFAVTAAACQQVGWDYQRTAGPGVALGANLRWLAGYRHRRCEHAGVADQLLEVFAVPKPLMTGAREAGDQIAVLPVLYHLLWRQVLITDVSASLLGPRSVVSAAPEDRPGE